jgi:hypothetical protein
MSSEAGPIRIRRLTIHPVVRQGIAGLVAVFGHESSRRSVEWARSHPRNSVRIIGRHTDGFTDTGNERARCNDRDSREFQRHNIVLTTYAGDVQVMRALKASAGLPAKK